MLSLFALHLGGALRANKRTAQKEMTEQQNS